jgi:hypothetical protein
MPVNSRSHLRKTRLGIHGWKADVDGGVKFYTSLKPREANAPKNEHKTSREALQEASRRHLPMIWEKPEEI